MNVCCNRVNYDECGHVDSPVVRRIENTVTKRPGERNECEKEFLRSERTGDNQVYPYRAGSYSQTCPIRPPGGAAKEPD